MMLRSAFGPPRFTAAALLLTCTWGAGGLSRLRSGQPLAQPFSSIPMNIGEWRGSEGPPLTQTALDLLKATETLSRSYRLRRGEMDVFLAYYEDQRAGESLHSPRHCLPGAGWEVLDHRIIQIPVDGTSTEINQYTIQRDRDKLIVLYWYQSRRRTLASEYAGKFWLMWDGVVTGDTGAALVRVTLPPALLSQGLPFAGQLAHQVEQCFRK